MPNTGLSCRSPIYLYREFLIISSEIFENFAAVELDSFVKENMKKYFELVQCKVDSEQDVGDTSVLVQALDRFYRRTESNSLCKGIDVAK